MSMQLRRIKRVPRGGLGGIMDFVMETNPTLARYFTNLDPGVQRDRACLESANKAVAAMDNAHDDLVRNWNPSGFYTVQQMDAVMKSTFAMLTSATQTVDKALAEPLAQGDRDALVMVRTRARMRMGGPDEGGKFLAALNQAKNQGIDIIDSPGFKRWITGAMRDASSCIVAVHYVLCARPWFVGALQGFMAVFNAAYSVARAIAGVAADVVRAAGGAVLSIPDTIATVIKAAKWTVIGGLAYLLYKGEHKKLLAKF